MGASAFRERGVSASVLSFGMGPRGNRREGRVTVPADPDLSRLRYDKQKGKRCLLWPREQKTVRAYLYLKSERGKPTRPSRYQIGAYAGLQNNPNDVSPLQGSSS